MKSYQQFKNAGFTLLEVLIAMLVLSIGMLGIAGLQATSLQYSLDAASRTQVTLLAEDIITKMRMRTSVLDEQEIPAIITEYTQAVTGACNPVAVGVVEELQCFNKKIADLLPDGQLAITTTGAREVTISISWFERGVRGFNTETTQATGTAGDALREGTRFFTLSAII